MEVRVASIQSPDTMGSYPSSNDTKSHVSLFPNASISSSWPISKTPYFLSPLCLQARLL